MQARIHLFTMILLVISSASHPTHSDVSTKSDAFGSYWYAGKAEITSYELEQARYGEVYKGHAVLIYVGPAEKSVFCFRKS